MLCFLFFLISFRSWEGGKQNMMLENRLKPWKIQWEHLLPSLIPQKTPQRPQQQWYLLKPGGKPIQKRSSFFCQCSVMDIAGSLVWAFYCWFFHSRSSLSVRLPKPGLEEPQDLAVSQPLPRVLSVVQQPYSRGLFCIHYSSHLETGSSWGSTSTSQPSWSSSMTSPQSFSSSVFLGERNWHPYHNWFAMALKPLQLLRYFG